MAAAAEVSAAATAPQVDDRLPLTGLGMIVVAFLALALSSNSPFLMLFSVAVMLSHASSRRMKKGSAGAWIVRTFVLGAVLVSVIFTPELTRGTLYFTIYLQLLAQLCAGELVVQCWQSPASTTPRSAGAVLLSGVVFLASSTDFNDRTIWYFTPIYSLLVLLTLRQFRRRPEHSRYRQLTAGFSGTVALVIAIGIGAGTSTGVYRYRTQITNWFLEFMMRYRPVESSGIARRPQLGKVFELRQSPKRVMKLEGAPGPLHLRGLSYDRYLDGAWGPDLEDRRFDRVPLPILQPSIAPTASHVAVTRLSDDYRILFVPLNSARIDTPARFAVQYAGEFGGPLRMERFGIYEYSFSIFKDELHQGPLCAGPDLRAITRLLQLPPRLNPRVRQLAQQIMATAKTPQDKVRAVEKYLTTNHSYSLSTDPGPGDPVTNFLLEKKSAHCEYFASAATILLRCEDVPTRYVTGYLAHEKHENGEMIVRERDAHAWAESFIPGVGWITVEATPGDGRPDESKEDLPFWTRVWEWMQDTFAAVRDWVAERTPTEMISAVGVLGLLFALIQIVRQLRANQAGKAASHAYHTPGQEFQLLAAAFEAELKRRGRRCPETKTWDEYVCNDGNSQAMRSFVATYNRVRFGSDGKILTDDIVRLRELLAAVKSEPAGNLHERPVRRDG